MNTVWKLCGILTLAAILINPAMTATYKWTDKEGKTVYSQHPPKSGPYQRIDLPKTNRYGRDSGKKDSSSGLKDLQSRAKALDTKHAQDKSVSSETEKNEKLRAENCKTARKNLEVYQVYRRFKDKDGNVTRMPDEERLKKIEEAKDAIKQFCE